jgi:hypothetical protein
VLFSAGKGRGTAPAAIWSAILANLRGEINHYR